MLGFTAHAVIFTDADPGWVAAPAAARRPRGAAELGVPAGSVRRDGPGRGQHRHALRRRAAAWTAADRPGIPSPAPAHPRIERALSYRDGVRAWRADGGVVLLGQGRGGPLGDRDRGRRRAGASAASAGRWPARPGISCPTANRCGRRSPRPTRPACGHSWRPGSRRSARRSCSPGPAGCREDDGWPRGIRRCGCARPRCDDSGMNEGERVIDNPVRVPVRAGHGGVTAVLVVPAAGRPAGPGPHRGARVSRRPGNRRDARPGGGGPGVREGLTVVPLCPFARKWLERHPQAASGVSVDWGPPPDD